MLKEIMHLKQCKIEIPGECSQTDELREVPQADQSIGTACGKVLASWVKLYAYAVGWMSTQHVLWLQIWITKISQTETHYLDIITVTLDNESAYKYVPENLYMSLKHLWRVLEHGNPTVLHLKKS